MGNVTSFHVTGDWRHVVDDGMVDVDALPDEALPTGHVVFTPLSPKVAVAGSPAVAHTLGKVSALIAGGELTDLQGREGVWLAGKIGDQTVRWRAVTELLYKKQKIAYPVLEFDLVDDAVLTGLIQNSEPGQPPIVVDPRIEALVRDAQAALNQTRTMFAEATEFHEDVEQWHGEIMPAAAQVSTDAQAAHDDSVSANSSAGAAAASAADAAGSEQAAAQSASSASTSASKAQDHAADVDSWHNDVETWHPQIKGWHEDVDGWQARIADDTQTAHDASVSATSSENAAAASASDAADSEQAAAASASNAATSANEAQSYAEDFDLSVSGTSTGAPGSNAAVTVSSDGPAYTLGFTIPQGEQGDPGPPGEVSQAALDAAIAGVLGGVDADMDTLAKIADAIDGIGGGGTEGIAVGEGDASSTTPTAGQYGVAIGWDAATGEGSAAIGYNASAAGDYSAAIGNGSNAAGRRSAAIGYNASAAGDYSAAIGYDASAAGDYSAAIGNGSNAAGVYSAAVGYYSNAAGDLSAAIGCGSTASGEGSAAIGTDSVAEDDWTIAIGADPNVMGQTHHVIIPGTLDVAGGITIDGAPISGGEVSWPDVTDKPATFPPGTHKHPIEDIEATGTPSATTFLRGDKQWATPTNTTYAAMTQAVADTGTSTTANTVSGKVLRDTIGKAAVQNATYGTPATLWFGSESAYNALPAATKNAAGFVAVITA